LPGTNALPETAALEEATPVPLLAPLLERAPERNPRLAALRARIVQAEKLRAATKLESYPDFDLSAGYRVRERVAGDAVDGDDFISAGVTIRLPINRSKWRSRVAEKSALLRRAQAEYRAERSELRARVQETHASLVRSDQQSSLVATGLLQQARQSLASSRSGYEVGRVDFPSLLDSQVRLLDAELRLVRAQAERRSAFAALEAAVGEVLR
jgi:outer membrane protein TolC